MLAGLRLTAAAALVTLLNPANRPSHLVSSFPLLHRSEKAFSDQKADTQNWQTFSTDNYSYTFPESLVRVTNPRNFPSSPDLQYYLLDQDTADEYLQCLQMGAEQLREHDQTGKSPEVWVDWEGGCDINRVVFIISAKQTAESPETDFYINEITDTNQRNWSVYGTVDMGDFVGLTAIYAGEPNFVFSLNSHERVLQKFLDIETPLNDAASNPEYVGFLEDILVQMLSSLKIDSINSAL